MLRLLVTKSLPPDDDVISYPNCTLPMVTSPNQPLARIAAGMGRSGNLLALNGVPIPDIDVDAAETFMLAVAKGELTQVAQIEAHLLALY